MINYRESLSDEEIKRLASDITGEWIEPDLDKKSTRGILCYKVLLEDLINAQNTDVQIPEFQCNILLSKWLKATKEENEADKNKNLLQSIEESLKKLRMIMGGKSHITDIELYDLCVYFSRLFTNKKCTSTITKIIDQKDSVAINTTQLKVNLFLACKNIVLFTEEPINYAITLTPSQILIITQGLLFDYKVRIPEQSDLFIYSLPFALMSRHSQMHFHLQNYLTEINNDRYNRELYECYLHEQNYHISHSLLHYTLKKHMASFAKYSAGRNYDFNSCTIADIDADYIMIQQKVCTNWFKKGVFGFMFKTVLKFNDSDESIQLSTPKSKSQFNDFICSEDIHRNYYYTVIINSLHKNIRKDWKKYEENYIKSYGDMIGNVKNAKEAIHYASLPKNYSKNEHLISRSANFILDKRSIARSLSIVTSCSTYIDSYEGMHIDRLNFTDFAYNDVLESAAEHLAK